MLLGADGSGLAQEVALARSTGGCDVSADKTVVPTAFYQMLPFSRNYAAGESFTLELKPQRSFRADNLVVTSPEGPFFELNAWLVGQENVVAQGSVNCAAFSEGAAQRGLDMRGYTANQGALINLGFINMDTEPHGVSGMLTGPAMMKIG